MIRASELLTFSLESKTMKYILPLIFTIVFSFAVIAQYAPTAPECVVGFVEPYTTNFPIEGGSGYFTVNEQNTPCAASPKSSASWLLISKSSSGINGSTWLFRVESNPGLARTASITISGATVLPAITQNGITCTFTPSATTASIPAAQTNSSFIISAYPGCVWNPVSQVDWITPTSGSWSGSGTLAYTVAANPTNYERTGTITAGGNTFTVTQAAGAKSRKRVRFF
jgi:hypothetical protein